MANLRDASKQTYATRSHVATESEIKTGCLQRIADATELMAKSHAELERSLRLAREERDRAQRWLKHEENKTRALRGVITKLKKRLKDGSDG
jgi:hypothetical protein